MYFHRIDMKLASNTFTYRTLIVFKLNDLTIQINIPQINNISPLKTLYMDNVHFITHTHIIDFLFSFHILEKLQANNLFLFG